MRWDEPDHSFFFRAEDGIRDIGVTGVQTCALPILRRASCSGTRAAELGVRLKYAGLDEDRIAVEPDLSRSEERRVGKECRYPWWTYQCKKRTGVRVVGQGDQSSRGRHRHSLPLSGS